MKINEPFFYHLELSSKCALKCPRCPRTEFPGKFKETELSLDFIKRNFPEERLAGISRILLCGGDGDPIYCKDFLEIAEYIKQANPSLELNLITNGSYKKPDWWRRLKSIFNEHDKIVFSLDGWDQESNEIYRVNCDWPSIQGAVETLKGGSYELVWSAIRFSFNVKKLDTMRDMAKHMGFDTFVAVRSPLFGSRVAEYIDPDLGFDPFEPADERMEAARKMAGETVASKVHEKSVFTLSDRTFPQTAYQANLLSSLENIESERRDNDIIPLCQVGDRGLYISAAGIMYPCSWAAHPFNGRKHSEHRENYTESFNESYFIRNRHAWNLNEKTIDQIFNMESWKQIEKNWGSPLDCPIICEKKCHKDIHSKRAFHMLRDHPRASAQ